MLCQAIVDPEVKEKNMHPYIHVFIYFLIFSPEIDYEYITDKFASIKSRKAEFFFFLSLSWGVSQVCKLQTML